MIFLLLTVITLGVAIFAYKKLYCSKFCFNVIAGFAYLFSVAMLLSASDYESKLESIQEAQISVVNNYRYSNGTAEQWNHTIQMIEDYNTEVLALSENKFYLVTDVVYGLESMLKINEKPEDFIITITNDSMVMPESYNQAIVYRNANN